MNRSCIGKIIMWVFLLVFIIAGVYVGVLIGREIWSWFNTPGQSTAWRNLSTGDISVYEDTSSNIFWDIVFGFLGLSAGVYIGSFAIYIIGKMWEKITKKR